MKKSAYLGVLLAAALIAVLALLNAAHSSTDSKVRYQPVDPALHVPNQCAACTT